MTIPNRTESILDLFQPHTLIETLQYQATASESDCWEQHHIEAMLTVCRYIQTTYPAMYKQIQHIHTRFQDKEADF